MKKLIIISGGPCVGKSTVGKRVFEHYSNSAYCDGDWCWCVNPESIRDNRQQYGDRNMAFLLSTYLEAGYDYVVFSSVVMTEPETRERVIRCISSQDYELHSFRLVCSEDTLKGRFDAKGGRAAVSFFWAETPSVPGEQIIDTDNKTPEQVAREIWRAVDKGEGIPASVVMKETKKAAKKTVTNATAKKTVAKKAEAKPAATAKKETVKKAAQKKPAAAAKKTAATEKKTAAAVKKTAAKKTTEKKTTEKKPAAKKTAAKKTAK